MELRSNALTTLEAVSLFFGEGCAGEEAVLIQLINQASASIERALDRTLRKQTYIEQAKGTGSQYLVVKNYPIRAVEYVKQAGEVLPPGLYDFSMQGGAGILYKDDGWTYTGYPYGLTGDSITGSRSFEVRYTAGYVLPGDATPEKPCDLPADLEGLAQEMVQSAFGKLQTGGSAGLRAFSISDVHWEWAADVPQAWRDIINQHKRVWL